MAQTIKIKGNVSNALAVPSSLIERELAANFAARTLFGSDGKGVFQFYTGTDKYFDTSGYANNANKLGGQSIDYFASAEGVADSLAEIIDTLSDYVNEIATSGSGNAITSVSKSGKKLTFTKGATYLTGITSALVTGALGYTPFNAANFTKAKIKSTLGISDWALAATKPSYAFSELTGKPATISGYGITDAITTANIGSQSVASAAKLTTARTIWGQSFDGTGNVSGDLSLGTAKLRISDASSSYNIAFLSSTYGLYIGDGTSSIYDTLLWGQNIKLVTGTNGQPRVYVKNDGNVGIGTTSPQYKLDVNGTLKVSGAATFDGSLSNQVSHLIYDSEKANRLNMAWVNGLSCIYSLKADNSGYNDLRLGVTGNTSSQLYFDASESKWGIGTSAPEYKLDVNGEARVTKLVIGDGTIEWDAENKGFKVVGGLYSESYLSAKGANSSGSSSSGGLVTSIWKEDNLGDTFNKSANDTFNAYAINSIHNRVSVLEGKATNVTYSQTQTSGTALGVITIDGASKTIYAPTIPTADINKGVTAYGWGNHANAGYLTQHQDLSGYQTKITSSNKLAYSLISGTPTLSAVATSGKYSDLSGTPTIPTALKSPYALTFGSKTYDGSSAKTIVASDLGALTAHQTIYALTIKNSAGTTQLTYTPNSAAGSLTLTKAMVGLGNVENTALSTWKGTSNITTLGTITSGTWNGTKIANSYLANSAITIAGTSVSLGGSITATTLQSNLGLGALAYKGSLSFAELTNKPTTLSGYGITDAYTASQIDTKLGDYLPLSGGTLTGGLTLSTGNFVVRKGDTVTGKLYPLNDGETLLGQEARRWSDIKTVLINGGTPINSENIGSQSVASAAKLTTARTIWGQSFDGTGNVSGDLSLGTAKLRISDASSSYNIAFLSSTYGLYIGDGTSSIYDTLLWGQNINLVTGTNGQPRVYVKNDGNVGIGTTSPQYKLDVNGTLNASGAATLGSTLNVGGASLLESSLTVNGTSEFKSTLALGNGKYIVSKYSDGTTNHNILGLNTSNVLLVNYGAVDRNVKAWHYGNEFRFSLYTDGASVGTLAWTDSKLGVGTSAPEYTADIRGTLRTTLQAIIESSLEVKSKITLSGTTASTANIAFSRSSYNYITFPTDGSLCLSTATSTSGIVLRVTSTAIEPMTTATKSVGTSSKRWGAIYGVDGDFSGTLHATTGIYSDGYVSAKGQNTSSDIRLKNVLGDVELGVSAIANAPSIRFAWKNGGGIDVGSSAQYWQKLLPDAVKERDGRLEMQYANIALLSAIAIAKRVETHEERIERLEREVKELRIENVELKNKIGGIYGE